MVDIEEAGFCVIKSIEILKFQRNSCFLMQKHLSGPHKKQTKKRISL